MSKPNENRIIMDTPDDAGAQLKIQEEIIRNVLGTDIVKERIKRFKLGRDMVSEDKAVRAAALYTVIGNNLPLPEEIRNNAIKIMELTFAEISENIARNYVQNRIEAKVEKALMEKQDKYIDEMRLSILRKEKGPENSKTKKRYNDLLKLDKISLSRNIINTLRPNSFAEIIGQERAVHSLISKIASPYPQHIILYGPPGVGKTTAARIALEEAKKLKFTPYGKAAKFVEVDGTTLRWDPREIANPLLGSVHDPIYQGSKRDLADSGIPEPKPGLVTEAHGGVLFIDEIGELDYILQNKLLKVLEDKRVEFSSSYYDPDDESTPEYIKYLFEKGAPADFTLIGATTREPRDINPALKSRCTAVYFEPLTPAHIETIVAAAAKKLGVELEAGVPGLIARYTIEGRKAINILSDAYSLAVYRENKVDNITVASKDILEVLGTSRTFAFETLENLDLMETGHVYGLAVGGFLGSTLEIEATAYQTETGKGSIRFNDTAGSMAKDSVFNAASVIRKVLNKEIKDYDLHINVIGGANIDGPSAGCAITAAILSAIEGREMRQDVAVTGEISLKGKVKPVGGIFEKIYGAVRKGIRVVIIPKDNEDDIPKDITGIEVIPVSDISEVMEILYSKAK